MSKTDIRTVHTEPTVEQHQSTAATYRYRWSEGSDVTKVALARVEYGYGVLQHVRSIRTRQKGGPSECEIDTDATYQDLPEFAQRGLATDAEVDQWH